MTRNEANEIRAILTVVLARLDGTIDHDDWIVIWRQLGTAYRKAYAKVLRMNRYDPKEITK